MAWPIPHGVLTSYSLLTPTGCNSSTSRRGVEFDRHDGLLLRPMASQTGLPGWHPETHAVGPRHPRGPLVPLCHRRRGHQRATRAPDPRGAKKCTFLTPCGAKSWGSGGAPPTNLILLRNQRRARRRAAAVVRPGRPPPPGPTRPLPSRPGGGGGGWWWLVGHAPRESGSLVPPCGGKRSTPIAQAPSASSLRSSARASGDPVDPAIASTSMSPGAMRSRYRSSVAHVLTCFDQLCHQLLGNRDSH